MRIVFFSHPAFIGSQSMPRFTRMLAVGMEQRGHDIEVWSPKPMFYRIPVPASMRKWLGYIDQYVVFPVLLRHRLIKCSPETLFVLTDQALGPWVPLVSNRFHVIHCHDFMAQLSAIGEIAENPTSWTGCYYQAYIRRGYSRGMNFICVSNKTHTDLHRLHQNCPRISEVVYNGFNRAFKPYASTEARARLGEEVGIKLSQGYILHVGGNEWYKNRLGVIEIYNAWRQNSQRTVPLLMVGHAPSSILQKAHSASPYKEDIHWISGLGDEMVCIAYSGANVLLFPSLAEGFGWPIAEAMACGCPVITTNEAPMTEVAGEAGFYIPRRPVNNQSIEKWTLEAGKVVEKILLLTPRERESVIQKGVLNIERFDAGLTIDKIETIYENIIAAT
ncbi:glycosyltransferase [Pontibacter virosus]|uniref:Glycosyltransferase involved in cell wall biosynthesis n=1 Tax=Pontibacter virosus TaxID=1765052 RepID=A0A2U1AQH9_9BACT|nr:glycosyltransferase [Pontibacter virosus]PVY38672.1 glycosyltransferase involved in cell wall biosynthesis [Pontibacter virosus]